MSECPHVSVVVSTFNRFVSLRQTLNRLLDQQQPDTESYDVIVIGNHCTDVTVELAAAYVVRCTGHLPHPSPSKRGVSQGGNGGIRYARSQILAVTDDHRRRVPLLRSAAAFARVQLQRGAAAVRMSAPRVIAAHAVLALLIGGSLHDIVTGTEHWPLSSYPMFANVERSQTLDTVILRGIPEAPDAPEVPLREGSMIGPFDQCRLSTAVSRVVSSGDQTRVTAMLDDLRIRYEAARQRGEHDGPPLRTVRAYAAHWELDPAANNVDAPARSILVGESRSNGTAGIVAHRMP